MAHILPPEHVRQVNKLEWPYIDIYNGSVPDRIITLFLTVTFSSPCNRLGLIAMIKNPRTLYFINY